MLSSHVTARSLQKVSEAHLGRGRVALAVYRDAIIGLIHKMSRPRNVIQPGGLARPLLHLPGVGDKPHVHAIVLRKVFDAGEHLADVLCLADMAVALVVQLVVGVDD